MTQKWRLGDDPLADNSVFDTLQAAMRYAAWELMPDGLWYQAGDTEGCTQEEVIQIEEIVPVREFDVISEGTVRVSYTTKLWCRDKEEALKTAKRFPDELSGSDYEQTEPPSASDFNEWAKEIE